MNFLKHPTEMADRTENIVKGDEGVRGGGGLDTGLILVTFSEGIDITNVRLWKGSAGESNPEKNILVGGDI